MINQEAVLALKRHIEEILKEEGLVRIVCDKRIYRITKDKTSYKFDGYGVFLTGSVLCTYQCSCVFGRVYIPYETITALTGKDI